MHKKAFFLITLKEMNIEMLITMLEGSGMMWMLAKTAETI